MAEKKRKRGMSWDEANPNTGGGNKSYLDLVKIQKFGEEYVKFRLVGPVYEFMNHWIPTLTKNGKKNFSKPCLKNDDPNAYCPYCAAGFRTNTVYLSNAIIRDIQDDKPANEKKLAVPKDREFLKKDDTFWTPIRVVQLTSTIAQKIKSYKAFNKVKTSEGVKTFDLNNTKYGVDVLINYDDSRAGAAKYDIMKDERTPLTREEREYLLYDLETIYDTVETKEEALQTLVGVWNRSSDIYDEKDCDLKSLRKIVASAGANMHNEDDDDDDIPRKKKSKIKSRVDDLDEEEDLDDDDLDEDEDEDEEEKPRKKSKGKSKSSKYEDDDDLESDDDEDDDLDEYEDDEKPTKRNKKSKKVKEDDLDEDDLDEEEEEKPRKKSSKSSSKKKSKSSKYEDDDDEDDDLDDEDEEDHPKSKNKKSSKPSKYEDDEDDDDDLDLDDEDEEEEEEPVKKSKKRK